MKTVRDILGMNLLSQYNTEAIDINKRAIYFSSPFEEIISTNAELNDLKTRIINNFDIETFQHMKKLLQNDINCIYLVLDEDYLSLTGQVYVQQWR